MASFLNQSKAIVSLTKKPYEHHEALEKCNMAKVNYESNLAETHILFEVQYSTIRCWFQIFCI